MKRDEALCGYFFSAPHPFAQRVADTCRHPWEIVGRLGELFALEILAGFSLKKLAYNIWAEDGVTVEGGATIEGRLIAGRGTVVRRNAVVRGDVVAGRGCVIGNFTEVKNALLYDGVQLPHLSYVGDSVLGAGAHLGAGAKISNFKSFATEIHLDFMDGACPLGIEKFGAVLGDAVEVGCNAVLNPGSLLGPRSVVYPLVSFRGTAPAGTLVKSSSGPYVQRTQENIEP